MDTKKLRQKILDLAIRGKLVPQDPNDEPASVLLERIKEEKERLIKEGKIRKSKKTVSSDTPHYGNVPFEVPDGWCWCKLDDLAFYKKGPFGSSLTKSMFVPDSPNAYKVYEQKNAISKDATLGHYFIDKDKYDELKGFAVQPEDIIVSCAGTIGETYVLPLNIREGIINQALMTIRLFDKSISNFYLLYFDFILKREAAKESKGTAIKNIPPFDILKNFFIPLPPPKEQIRIIEKVSYWLSFVDAIDSEESEMSNLISKTKSKILDLAIHGKLVLQDPNDEPAIELLKRINPDFTPCDNGHSEKLPQGWCQTNLGTIGIWQSGGTPSRSNKSYYGGNIPWLKTGDLNDGLITDIPESITEEAVLNSSAKINPTGSVLIAMYGATIGKLGILTFPATTNQACCACIEFNAIAQLYLFYFLLFQRSAFIAKGGGGAQPNISKEIIVNTFIPLPPIKEQQRIVQKIKELFSVLDNIQNSLEV
ncbi:type I restriction modification DNA specificity domain protein [Bacteroides ovatus str. 3725 D9 iii]|uniref:restriction endonuclease subunit S n=1 Tax=Bacteroides ovatus TaxID=28116 RepID=UPI0004DA03BC|nr:restriction endonuclease subunit S [Bacteroides ovatus]KDS36664.1 type I restriction modification DNA specificity domain protein [Bacteroides ovatus str. 3725 D9 iii]MCS2379701.1 restriction endonuclease subunit S [Bacteroides ovatus]